jgi:hypothetical protein
VTSARGEPKSAGHLAGPGRHLGFDEFEAAIAFDPEALMVPSNALS